MLLGPDFELQAIAQHLVVHLAIARELIIRHTLRQILQRAFRQRETLLETCGRHIIELRIKAMIAKPRRAGGTQRQRGLEVGLVKIAQGLIGRLSASRDGKREKSERAEHGEEI